MTSIRLLGLNGRNPLAYFAALGCLSAVTRMRPQAHARLSWSAGAAPTPVLDAKGVDPDDLVTALDEDRHAWEGVPVLAFRDFEDVKLSAEDQRDYLQASRVANDGGRSAGLVTSLIAEGTFAKTGDRRGKPSDLHFTAGNQKFLVIARTLQREATAADVREAVLGPWRYDRRLPTFGWDFTDDRVYAYGFSNPAKTDKFTVPGADWLGLLGLSAYPVCGRGEQASPAGASGSWKRGTFRWGLWAEPLNWDAACSLTQTGYPLADVASLRARVFRVLGAHIRRSDQGGYGSFSPSSVLWDARDEGGNGD